MNFEKRLKEFESELEIKEGIWIAGCDDLFLATKKEKREFGELSDRIIEIRGMQRL